MKFTKKQKTWVFIIIIIGIVAYFGLRPLLISIPYLDTQVKDEVWQDIPLKLTSVYFGTISSSNTLEFQPIKEGFCGNNDADTTISNSYTVGDSLSLRSSISSNSGTATSCSDFNYIFAEIELPAGTLTAKCDMSLKGGDYSYPAGSGCSIEDGNGNKLFDSGIGSQWEGSSLSNSETKTITLTQPTKLKFSILGRATDQKNDPAYAKSDLTLQFQKEILPPPPKPEPTGFLARRRAGEKTRPAA